MKICSLFTLLLLYVSSSTAAIPDLTKSLPENAKSDYILGPTGMRGWMHTTGERVKQQDIWITYSTAEARQVLVTQIDEGSPADGVINVGDVIFGIGQETQWKKFSASPRVQLAEAIDEAEKTKNEGKLHLRIWRPVANDLENHLKENSQATKPRPKGTIQTVTLQLKVMGTYSATAPFDCPKTDAIRKQTVAAVMLEKPEGVIRLPMLALLASGDEAAMEKAKAAIKAMGKNVPKIDDENIGNQNAWRYGYTSLVLAEYYLLTKDASVLPAIRSMNDILSRGQSITGDWGHKMAGFEFNNGSLHGRLHGYAALNHSSLTCYYALLLGKKCGVENPEILNAIKKSTANFSDYIHKGVIGYGYHSPRDQLYTNNGMSGMAALIFDVQGNKEGARFYALHCAAAAHMIETGHTGPYFNPLWTPLGAHVGGPELTTAYLKQWRWLQTITRKWNGGFAYQRPGGGRGSYRRLSASSTHLLYLSLPQRKLITTGRESDPSTWVNKQEAQELASIALTDFNTLQTPDLLAKVGHELPPIRIAAAKALVKRTKEADSMIPTLTKMLKGTYQEKLGACHALESMKEKAAPALDSIMQVVRDAKADSWLRQNACKAMIAIGKPAIPTLKELATILLELPVLDQRRELEQVLGLTIAKLSKLAERQALDKQLRFEVAKKLLNHPHHLGRYYGMSLVDDITLEDLHIMADEIITVIKNDNKDYTSYTNDKPRAQGLAILERLNIQEGLDLTVATLDANLWGQKYRLPSRYELLEKYGANAKKYIPLLEEKLGKQTHPTIEKIKASTKLRTLIPLKEIPAH